jgi:hypothetical protein
VFVPFALPFFQQKCAQWSERHTSFFLHTPPFTFRYAAFMVALVSITCARHHGVGRRGECNGESTGRVKVKGDDEQENVGKVLYQLCGGVLGRQYLSRSRAKDKKGVGDEVDKHTFKVHSGSTTRTPLHLAHAWPSTEGASRLLPICGPHHMFSRM